MKRKLLVVLAVIAVLAWAATASANTIQVFMNVPNAAMSAFTGPYVEVDITASGGNATFDVTALTGTRISDSAAVTYALMGGSGVFGLNTNDANLGITGITPSFFLGAGFPNDSVLTPATTQNIDGLGSYSITINNSHPGYPGAIHDLSFTTTGVNFANAEAVLADLIPNSQGYTMAADIAAALSPITFAEGALATGGAAVPVPPSALLLGAGLLGLVGLGWRKRS